MQSEVQHQKAALRKEVGERTKRLSVEERLALSGAACNLLRAQKTWREASSILFYAPRPDEVDLWPLTGEALRQGKLVALPRYVAETDQYEACQVRDLEADLRIGRYGIREPTGQYGGVLINQLDLIMVPGVAFDLQGRRLGRGKGHYDQLLAAWRGRSCGVAFDEQLVREIPLEPHDAPVNCILTPSQWVEF
jgi:5-formyltetrahydrofolate cyclo-ligase